MYGDDASVEKSDHELDGVSFKEIGFVGGATLVRSRWTWNHFSLSNSKRYISQQVYASG